MEKVRNEIRINFLYQHYTNVQAQILLVPNENYTLIISLQNYTDLRFCRNHQLFMFIENNDSINMEVYL